MVKVTDPLQSEQWYQDDTYYQILLVAPRKDENKGQYIETTIVAKTRKEFQDIKYLTDHKTQVQLLTYPQYKSERPNTIGSYLPFPGALLAKDFLKTLLPSISESPLPLHAYIEDNNFYGTIQTLLQTRKISQLIAKTWFSYLTAKQDNNTVWNKFAQGEWTDIDSDILDGLIAREIFFFDQISSPDNLEPPNLNIYYPLLTKTGSSENARFLILPSSRGWQGITLSLLFAGQAYYEVKTNENTYYHQICQPILSTGDIVFRYGLEVDWNRFKGEIKELQLEPRKYSVSTIALVPYPPIPSELNLPLENIKKWAEADDEDGELPFYYKENDGYLVDVQYFIPPYPYLPLSTC